MHRTTFRRPTADRAVSTNRGFAVNEQLVHASHGVGRVSSWQELVVDGHTERMLVIDFPATRMTMRVPAAKIRSSSLRSLASHDEMIAAVATVAEAAVPPSGPWKGRHAAYLEKFNSGQPMQLAELVRDLRGRGNGSAAKIYDDALARLAEELAIIDAIPVAEAKALIEARSAAGTEPAL